MSDDERCCFDDWVDDWKRQLERKEVARPVTAAILDALDDAGFRGRSFLDLGCGVGDLSVAAVRRGAANAHGFDLSRRAIDGARGLARTRGVEDRTTFDVGDAAVAPLPETDVVALNRVFCCYPGLDALLERSLAATRTVYAFTIPRSRGPAALFARIGVAISNAWYALRARKYQGFRVFMHDVDAIDARVREAGFRRLVRRPIRLTWELAVYERVTTASA
jgi:2-polyprenyl-3-methyl-5-hydroxy-6-metoxy-1,4-benzoquinol methylase